MNMNVAKGMEGIVEKTLGFAKNMGSSVGFDSNMLRGLDLSVGLASDPEYQPGPGALTPAFFQDKAIRGAVKDSAEIQSMLKSNPEDVGYRSQYNFATNKFDIEMYRRNKGVRDADVFASGQVFSPSSASWIPNIFVKPLIWSNAKKSVSITQGTDPWAVLQNLGVADFVGSVLLNNAGGYDNVSTNDVEVQSGYMTQPIINIESSYKLSIQEIKRGESSSGAPWTGSLIPVKQAYANWIIELMTDALIYYGNAPTGNTGLFTVNAINAWSSIGSSLTTIAAGSSTTKGSDMYNLVSTAVRNFMTGGMNKFKKVVMAISPLAYNILATQAYSANYDSRNVLEILQQSFKAGKGEYDTDPELEIVSDPLLMPGTLGNFFNGTNAYDYMVLSAPEIGGGVNNTPEPLVQFAIPLMNFIYPVIPGQYNTQYKILRRVGGIFAPATYAVAVYSGFGV